MSDQSVEATHLFAASGFTLTTILGFAGWLPFIGNVIVSIVGFIWFMICIKESKTYIHWTRNRAMKRNARRLVKLRAKEKIAIAKIEAAEKMRQARVAARDLLDHEIAEAAKLVASNQIVTRADVIVRKDADQAHEEAKHS